MIEINYKAIILAKKNSFRNVLYLTRLQIQNLLGKLRNFIWFCHCLVYIKFEIIINSSRYQNFVRLWFVQLFLKFSLH